MFTDIADSLPDTQHIFTDLDKVDEARNEITITALSDKAALLNKAVAAQPRNATIDIIAHSQGCLVTALSRPKRIRRAILLAPPTVINVERSLTKYAEREGAHINEHGLSSFPRRDGSTTLIPPQYWQDMRNMDIVKQFNALADLTDVVIVEAKQDELIAKSQWRGLDDKICLIGIPGDHNFTGDDRAGLLATIRELLV